MCNNLLPIAMKPKQMKYQSSNLCALCHQPKTTQHMLRCPHESREKWRFNNFDSHAGIKANDSSSTAVATSTFFCKELTTVILLRLGCIDAKNRFIPFYSFLEIRILHWRRYYLRVYDGDINITAMELILRGCSPSLCTYGIMI